MTARALCHVATDPRLPGPGVAVHRGHVELPGPGPDLGAGHGALQGAAEVQGLQRVMRTLGAVMGRQRGATQNL